MNTNATPPALAALAAFPHLQDQAGRWLAAQSRRIAERTAHFVPRPALLKTLDDRILALSGGLIALEGALGSGTTALLCHLAATRPYAFWLPEDDAGAGLEALCAQLLALHDLPVPLVPPAAGRDATTLERLLAEAGARRPLGDPLVVLIDRPADEHTVPRPPAFLSAIPPGVVVVLACAPKASLPIHAAGRIALPTRGPATERHLAQAAVQRGCPPALAVEVAARGQGSFLYVHLTAGLLKGSVLEADRLPDGQEALHQECEPGRGSRRAARPGACGDSQPGVRKRRTLVAAALAAVSRIRGGAGQAVSQRHALIYRGAVGRCAGERARGVRRVGARAHRWADRASQR
jgi:hypothetical protein